MKNCPFKDPFADRQPKKSFIQDLIRPMHEKMPVGWNTRNAETGELFISVLSLRFSFPDDEGLLETSYADFKKFLKSAGITEDEKGILFSTQYGKTECKEAYRIQIEKDGIRVIAADTEGIRRALIFLEDEMYRREGSFLPFGELERKPFVKTRISRCAFSPPSHNDNEGMVSELESDEEYYPEGYLNRLMHDGINGLWIGADFKKILKSDIFPEFGENSERLLKKLNEIVERCRRYGIGIYLFSIEPSSAYQNPALEKRKELHGGTAWEGTLHLFCTASEEFERYINESVERLFTAVPHLKGFINITVGERLSGCGSSFVFNCPKCAARFGSHGATLAAQEKMFADAMKKFAPEAEFISWTYSQRIWEESALQDSLQRRDASVIHMQNFEDCGVATQLGKERTLFDYWLAFTGPGELMKRSVAVNRERGISTYAKLQVCTSFDFSSTPYVPVPGILYDKFQYMYENGISGALLCWYFGNYPGLMNKASCELSFEPYFPTKREFLVNLARTYWGKDAERIADAWEAFEKSYQNVPFNKAFQWFSPLSDSPVAPLHLLPVDLPMPSVWKVTDPVGGDRIGESLLDGHTLEEAVLLTDTMRSFWEEGQEVLSTVSDGGDIGRKDQKAIASAIGILIASANALLRFYNLRRTLALGGGKEILHQMERIAKEEMKRSKKLAKLCVEYPYLGYQSEANGFKFFKEKLLWRVGELQKMLAEEFPLVRERMENGKPPLAFYLGEKEGARVCTVYDGEIENACPLPFLKEEGKECEYTTVAASEKGGVISLRFVLKGGTGDSLVIKPEFRLFHPSARFTLEGGRVVFEPDQGYGLIGEALENRKKAILCTYRRLSEEEETYTLAFRREDLGMAEGETFRLAVERKGRRKEVLAADGRVYLRLIGGRISPDAYVFFVK